MKRISLVPRVVFAALIALAPLTVSAQKPNLASYGVADEPEYQGKNLSFWLKIIRDRNVEMIPLAFDAIRSLGPRAWSAAPELTRIVAAPFVAVNIGKDPDEVVATKLYDIELRSEAIEALASIGESASPATAVVVQWALTLRVASENRLTPDEAELFIELVTLDAEYRLRVIAAVTAFGKPATTALVRLLKSENVEKRKIAVAILGLDALTLAADLLKSPSCEDRQLAIAILGDMEPIVARSYIAQFSRGLVCQAN
jgi:hypothetical protein